MVSEAGAWLSIGALARATGIATETLRTWESRYGYPAARRKPSGHRVYPISSVDRLRRISRALELGHRAGEVLPASDADLDRLLGLDAEAPSSPPVTAGDTGAFLAMVEALDAPRLSRALMTEAVRLGPLGFARSCVAPLLVEVGEAWAMGKLQVRHEHFLSERVADVLRSLRLPLESRATGPLALFATLPDEIHALGLQMAALVAAAAGLRVLYLGTNMPLNDLITVARELRPTVVALSVSSAGNRKQNATQLARLRDKLPTGTRLVVGGEGAPDTAGVTVIRDLDELDRWLRSLSPSPTSRG